MTSPVKFAVAPFADGREPLGEITVLSAAAGITPRRTAAITAPMNCRIRFTSLRSEWLAIWISGAILS